MAITETQSFTGRAGSVTINGVAIPITGWTAKLHKEFAISTDSNNFNPSTGQTYRSRAPGEIWIEFTCKGNYDLGGTTDANLSQRWQSDGPTPVVLAFTRTTNFASFNADLDDVNFALEVPGATMTTFDTGGQSNGVPVVY